MITVVVADDQKLIRQAVSDILDTEDDIDVIGQAIDGRDAAAQARDRHPDVVVMDIRMPNLDGIGATAEICADPACAGTKVLILTTFEEDAYVLAALRAGASGFLGKGAEPDEIVRAVRAVHAGDALLSPAATKSLITRHLTAPPSPGESPATEHPGLAQLTEREREVVILVARGRSNQEIADELVISTHTAKTHVNRAMTELHAHDRAQIVILAYENRLLVPGT